LRGDLAVAQPGEAVAGDVLDMLGSASCALALSLGVRFPGEGPGPACPGPAAERAAADEDDRLAGPVVLVADLDVGGILPADRDPGHEISSLSRGCPSVLPAVVLVGALAPQSLPRTPHRACGIPGQTPGFGYWPGPSATGFGWRGQTRRSGTSPGGPWSRIGLRRRGKCIAACGIDGVEVVPQGGRGQPPVRAALDRGVEGRCRGLSTDAGIRC
jgi:hypothetical protein